MKLIEGLHLTATEKRHIAEIIGKGWQSGNSGRKSYLVRPAGEYWRVRITTKERDDFGRPSDRVQSVVVSL